jgi:plasmid maintenance system antidote protein VapI
LFRPGRRASGAVGGARRTHPGSEFLENGETLAPRLAAPVAVEVEHVLMACYFAEAEIDAASTARRHFARDNSARLQRYFLDVQQEWAAKLDLALPQEQSGIARDMAVRLVNGVAGSGKTLIALSRALLLAEMHPQQRILMLIGVEKLPAGGGRVEPDREENARKLYMAMTRAGARLVVISSEPAPDSIRAAFTESPAASGAAA